MVEPHVEQAETLITQEHDVHSMDQSEEKQAVMEVTRLVTETEIDHGNANECTTEALDATTEPLDTNASTDEVHDVNRSQPGSDLAINIMSHMEISRLIANVVKRMQEEGAQTGTNTINLFHMENLLKQIVTNQNTITINQNSLLRNQQAIIQKVKKDAPSGRRFENLVENTFIESFTARFQPSLFRRCFSMLCDFNVIMFIIIIRVDSGFLSVENRDPLADRRTADVISVTSQSQPYQNFQQPMAFLLGIDHDHVKWHAKIFA